MDLEEQLVAALLRVAREVRPGRHAVALDGDPVGAQIAELVGVAIDTAFARDLRRDSVIGAAVAGCGVAAKGMCPSPAKSPEVGSSPTQPAPGR